MDKATEKELYECLAYARLNGLDLALFWLARAMKEPVKHRKTRLKARLPTGGTVYIDRERMREMTGPRGGADAPASSAAGDGGG